MQTYIEPVGAKHEQARAERGSDPQRPARRQTTDQSKQGCRCKYSDRPPSERCEGEIERAPYRKCGHKPSQGLPSQRGVAASGVLQGVDSSTAGGSIAVGVMT